MNKILFCAALLFLVHPAAAKTLTVSSAAEIKKMSKILLPGDTVIMKSGEWKDEQIVLRANGTESRPIVVRAEQAGKTVLTGTSQFRFSGSFIIVDGLLFTNGGLETKGKAVIEFRTSSADEAVHCRVTNCAIVNYNPPDKFLDYKWVSLYGSDNRVDHSYFSGKNHQGTLLVVWLDSLPNRHHIDHNFFGPRPEHGQNGAEIIRVGTSDWSMFSSQTVVENNYFYSCDGEVEIISNKSCDNVYRYNTFVECAGSLTLRHGNRSDVYGNYFFGHHKKRTGGVRVIGEDHRVYNNYFDGLEGDNQYSALSFMRGKLNSKPNGYFQVKNAVIAFNTFVDNNNGIVLGVQGSDPDADLPPVNCRIANNLIVKNRGMIINEKDPPENSVYEGNLIDGDISAIHSASQFRPHSVSMVKDSDAVWRLDRTSSAIDAAAGAYNFITTDIDGQQRTGIKDVGADECIPSDSIRHPLRRIDVGPEWEAGAFIELHKYEGINHVP
jgi:poly(beta-D-mannuronate) lyase